MAKNGLHLITPTSIAYTGTSASISANGSVEFTAVSPLSLNGVFSADYDNYMVVVRHQGTNSTSIAYRLRASGTDDSGANYVRQYLFGDGTSVTASRATSVTEGYVGATSPDQRSGDVTYFYGPFLAQPTASRTVNVRGSNNAQIVDWASTHNQSSSYDGLTLFMTVGGQNITGRVAVYGLRK